jgi:hypothetical protein
VALLAVAAIAVGLLVVQVIASPERSFELDPSYTEAEQNRFGALAGDSVSDEPLTQPTPRSTLNGEVWAEPVTRPTPRGALNGEVWAEPATTSTPISAIGGEVWSESTQ